MYQRDKAPLGAFSSPRPTPHFSIEKTFSTKKERGRCVTPSSCGPPKPPIKSCPPVSRIFPTTRSTQKAQVVSFRHEHDNASNFIAASPYIDSDKELYFNTAFEIVSKLGAGSFGDVFKVKSKEDGKLYAIKRSRDRFRGELDRLRKLAEVEKHEELPPHNNCVHFYRAWEERQHLYIQTELCHSSLNTFAEVNHSISETIIWNYLVDLLMALKHLHSHHLIHMDIKPENVFISKGDICKLGDFGLVLDFTKDSDLSEAQEGDPKYLAPELMYGKFGKAADIFSLGMTILELASDLDLPRGGDGWHQIRAGRIPERFLQARSFDLTYVIKQMLDPDPRTRPSVDQLMAFPAVRKVWKQRSREYMVNTVMGTTKAFFMGIIEYILLFFALLMARMRGFYDPVILPESTSTYPASSSSATPPTHDMTGGFQFDLSISDDDCFEDDILVNNSVGAPLDTSSSSESDMFLVPRKLAPRLAYTTPMSKRRGRTPTASPMSSSPVPPTSDIFRNYNASPGSSNSSFELDRPLTPTIALFGDDDEGKPNIEPKNLMDMFEAASDDED